MLLLFAIKIEKESVQAAILIAVKEERENMEKLHAEEKEHWQMERSKDREKIAEAVEDAMQEHRQNSQVSAFYLPVDWPHVLYHIDCFSYVRNQMLK